MLSRVLRRPAARVVVAGFGLMALTGGAGLGAAVDQQAMFNAYVTAPSYRTILQKAYNDTEPKVSKAQCPTMTLTSLDPPEIVVPANFVKTASGWQSADGAWVQRGTLDRCGSPVQRRVLVETAPNNTLRSRGLLPGQFAAGYRFEDKAKSVMIATLYDQIKCADWKNAVVVDTALKAKTAPKPGQPWSEIWTIALCGNMVKARLDYAPKGKDLNIYASVAAAH